VTFALFKENQDAKQEKAQPRCKALAITYLSWFDR
jgi:hypothetical protein